MISAARNDSNYLFNSENFALKGSLSVIPLPRLIYLIKLKSLNGILSLRKARSKKIISFKEGEPVFIVSNILAECLGRRFVKSGKISEEQCEQSLFEMKKSGKKQGEVLLSMGIVSEFEIRVELKKQARERMLDLFRWTSGNYEFYPDKDLRKDLTPLDLKIPEMIMFGVRAFFDMAFLKKYMDKMTNKIPMLEKDIQFNEADFKFVPWEARIIKLYDGKTSLRRIISERVAREEDVYKLTFVLAVLNLIKFIEPYDCVQGEKEKKKRIMLKKAIRLQREKAKQRELMIELTREFVINRKRKIKPKQKRKGRFGYLVLLIAASFAISIAFMNISSSKSVSFANYSDGGMIKSASFSGNVLTLVSAEESHINVKREEAHLFLEGISPQLKKDGYSKIKLTDSSGRVLGVALSNKTNLTFIRAF